MVVTDFAHQKPSKKYSLGSGYQLASACFIHGYDNASYQALLSKIDGILQRFDNRNRRLSKYANFF